MEFRNQRNTMPDNNSIELQQGRVIIEAAPPDPNRNSLVAGPQQMGGQGNGNYNNGQNGQNGYYAGNDYNSQNSYTKGYDTGYDRGYWQGYDKSYNDGYEEGYRRAREEAERNNQNYQQNNYQQGNFQQGNFQQQYQGYPQNNFQQNNFQQNGFYQGNIAPTNAYPAGAVARANGMLPADYYYRPIKNKIVHGVLGITLGVFGVQKFYMNNTPAGVLSCIFCFTGIPAIIGLVEGIISLVQSEAEFEDKHHVRVR